MDIYTTSFINPLLFWPNATAHPMFAQRTTLSVIDAKNPPLPWPTYATPPACEWKGLDRETSERYSRSPACCLKGNPTGSKLNQKEINLTTKKQEAVVVTMELRVTDSLISVYQAEGTFRHFNN